MEREKNNNDHRDYGNSSIYLVSGIYGGIILFYILTRLSPQYFLVLLSSTHFLELAGSEAHKEDVSVPWPPD